jgi:hypothetical protein
MPKDPTPKVDVIQSFKRYVGTDPRETWPELPYPTWGDTFLEIFRQTGNVRAAAQVAGISRSTVERYRIGDHPSQNVANHCRGNPLFAQRYAEAKEDATDALELKARERALRGESDGLLMFLLKANRPEVYNPRPASSLAADVMMSEMEAHLAEIRERVYSRLLSPPADAPETGSTENIDGRGDPGDPV